jgi:hypothetical protein
MTPLAAAPKTYWSLQWNWAQIPSGGYAGIQTDGNRQNSIGDIAIFSIWDATDAVPGPASWCLPFGGEGIGQSCRTNIQVVPDREYKITIFPDHARGNSWWAANLTAVGANPIYLGSIKAPSPNLSSEYFVNFIEYFGPPVACGEVGIADARFGLPIAGLSSSKGSATFTRPSDVCVNSELELDEMSPTTGLIMNFGGRETPSTNERTVDVVYGQHATRSWAKKMANESEAKLYAKNLVGAGKVSFRANGAEVAWVNAKSSMDTKLRLVNNPDGTVSNYLVRTIKLQKGKNVLEVFVDGKRTTRVSYSRK